MRLRYEPASEPLHIYVTQLFLNDLLISWHSRTRGQAECAAIAPSFVSALGDLLEHDKLQVPQ